IEAIFARLNASRTYTGDLANQDIDKHSPRAATMEHLLDALEANFGGAPEWLRRHGWTDDDAAALRKHLLD
ncbi:MAG: protein-tyrosine phosphatase, partial [Pseudonocardiales bacterium]|nr:protein-tyrosine phosphatase [Pseudonocardiales bacterium]